MIDPTKKPHEILEGLLDDLRDLYNLMKDDVRLQPVSKCLHTIVSRATGDADGNYYICCIDCGAIFSSEAELQAAISRSK